jgi:hypothetical protein
MNIFMRGENAVPIIVAKHTVTQEPKIEKRRRFVGLRAGMASLAEKAIDTVLECFWVTESEVIDKGESDVVQYAIDVSDDPGADGPELVVTKLDGRARPGCGIYCEVISVSGLREQQAGESAPPTNPESKARLVQPRMRRPDRPDRPKTGTEE